MKRIEGNIIDIYKRDIYYGYIEIENTSIVSMVKTDDERKNEVYIAPGLIDSHVHIESSMLTPQQFGRMAVEYGNIASVCDPHEIANVLGRRGVEYMINEAEKSSYQFFFAMPSCVPSTPFETNGSKFDADDMAPLVDKSVALAEMMNYVGVLNKDAHVWNEIDLYNRASKPIDGHVPGLTGDALKKYCSAGISTDHECSSIKEAEEKIALGMMIQVREGSSARNYEALKSLFSRYPDKTMVCMDDAHPDDIRSRGYINRFLKLAVRDGISIFDMYKAALLNTVDHYNLPVGTFRVGEKADFVVYNNIIDFNVLKTYISGELVYDSSNSSDVMVSDNTDINNFISRSFDIVDFAVKSSGCKAKVIDVTDGELLTGTYLWSHGCAQGSVVNASVKDDILKIAVINRYQNEPLALGFIRGVGMKKGAMASSIAHDSHNVVVIGASDESMVRVANEIFSSAGGIAVCDDVVVKSLSLPVAGLMTNDDYNTVADKYQSLIEFVHTNCGVTLSSPFMTMAFMSLVVIPSLKLSDKGLFDVEKFGFTDLFFD